MTRSTRIHTIVITVVVLALGGLVMVVVTNRSTGSRTVEMDHGPSDVAIGSPKPTASVDADGQMPGMDMSGEHGSEVTPSAPPTGSAEMPGMDMSSGDTHGTTPDHTADEAEVPDRPTGPVLFTFGGGTSAVLLTAGFLRRKDRIRSQAKTAARAARRVSR